MKTNEKQKRNFYFENDRWAEFIALGHAHSVRGLTAWPTANKA
jgi:hypothetical protein